ncbi:hypothetical protein ACVMIH_007519 [Bradyrhizobium sp. USDA 4503]
MADYIFSEVKKAERVFADETILPTLAPGSGTFCMGTNGRKAEAGAIYALYRGELSRLYSGVTIPNAICFSPDGALGYFADTAKNALYRVMLDPATGLPCGAPEVLLRHRGTGRLDGAVVDADGLIWNACWVAAASTSIVRKASICAFRRGRRVVRLSSGRICHASWLLRPGSTWTRWRVPPIRSTGAPF